MSTKPRIFDCFTFFNEFDLLEIRLSYLYPYVDHFIIAESDTTHNGAEKPFNFQAQRDRYKRFEDKIIYIASEMPEFSGDIKGAWKREGFQRDEIKRGLQQANAQPDDIVLLSDLDEIINAKLVVQLANDGLENVQVKSRSFLRKEVIDGFFGFFRDKWEGKKENRMRMRQGLKGLNDTDSLPVTFRMDNFYYFLNNREKERNVWKGAVCFNFRLLEEFTLNELRDLRRFPVKIVEDAGWHFSYLGGIEKIKHKLQHFAHQEFNVSDLVNDDYINFCIENGYSLFTYYKNKNIEPGFERVIVDVFPEEFRKLIANYPALFYS